MTQNEESVKTVAKEEVEEYRKKLTNLTEQLDEVERGQMVRLGHRPHSPLCDMEKEHQLLDTAKSRLADSVSVSITPTAVLENPDCINHTSGSLSDVSVACLQDQIIQMEESHYSTNEELQATLQELADLQVQLTELQSDNDRLGEEKDVLLVSLCRQTERLEDARTKVDTLQELLLDSPSKGVGGSAEREQKLVELLKSGLSEREVLLLKQEELNSEMNEFHHEGEAFRREATRLTERVKLLESTVDATHAERNMLDQALARAKEESSARYIEITRVTTQLDNARSKIEELKSSYNKVVKESDLEELLDKTRKEKELLETQTASLQEKLLISQGEVARLRQQMTSLQEECKVTRNNAKSAINDLEYECEKTQNEKIRLNEEILSFQKATEDLQVQYLDDKRQLKSLLSETQRRLSDCERARSQCESSLIEERRSIAEEKAEWLQFQTDLLLTVRVANDFKTEAQHEIEKQILECKQLRDQIGCLEMQVEQLQCEVRQVPSLISTCENDSVLASVTQEISRRNKMSRQDSRLSVKSLIESIENATKQAKNGHGGSRCSSTSSLNSITSHVQCSTTPTSPLREPDFKTPFRDLQQINNKLQNKKLPLCGERKDPLLGLVKNGGSKRNALLKWCQNKTAGYRNIDVTNFSSSWNDGLAFSALLHSYLPDRVPFDSLIPTEKERNFSIAFSAAESVGIHTTLNIINMVQLERPDWQQVMAYVTAIYRHFET